MLSLRNLIGTLLFLLLVGELTVGTKNGLFTPAGLVVLLLLYWTYFMLFDAMVERFRLTNAGMVLVNFALYSVLITGLLHGELADFVIPHSRLITALIRLQCSLFPLFAYALLGKPKGTNLRRSVGVFTAFILAVSLSGSFGIKRLIATFQVAPLVSLIFIGLGSAAVWAALRHPGSLAARAGFALKVASFILLVISFIPSKATFLLLLTVMIVFGIGFLLSGNFRRSTVMIAH